MIDVSSSACRKYKIICDMNRHYRHVDATSSMVMPRVQDFHAMARSQWLSTEVPNSFLSLVRSIHRNMLCWCRWSQVTTLWFLRVFTMACQSFQHLMTTKWSLRDHMIPHCCRLGYRGRLLLIAARLLAYHPSLFLFQNARELLRWREESTSLLLFSLR